MKPIRELYDRLKKEYDSASNMADTRSDSYNIEMRFSNLGALELAVQKYFLLGLLGTVEDQGECIEGLINLIESIQEDLNTAYDFPDEIVYPFSSGYEPDDREQVNYKRAFEALVNKLPLELLPMCLNLSDDLDILIKRELGRGRL